MSEFDFAAATLRQGIQDEKVFIEALATRLARALPHRVSISRDFHLFKKERPVNEVMVSLPDHQFILKYQKSEGIKAHIAQSVRGIRLSQAPVEINEWLKNLTQHLSKVSECSVKDFTELENFLMS